MIIRWSILSWLVGAVTLLVTACAGPPVLGQAVAPAVLQRQDGLPGQLLYVRDGNLWIWQDGDARQLTSGGTWRQPAFSLDGSEIAYAYREQNFSDLFAMAADGSASRRLTRGQASRTIENDWAFRPAWSPDGIQIAYISDASSPYPMAWLMNKDGGSRRQLSVNGANVEMVDTLSWSPDGRRLAITGMTTRDPSQIFVLDLARGSAERFSSTTQGALDPAWSPDGDTIAFVAREGARTELVLRRLDSSEEIRVEQRLAYLRGPAWSPDGRHLAVLSAQSGAFEVWSASVQADRATLRLGEFRQITRDGGIDAASGLSWAR